MAVQVHAVNVVFRLDDPRPACDSVSMRVVKLFNAKKVPLTIAMIPCDSCESIITPLISTSSQYIAAIQQDNIELALHGLTHQNINGAGEFGGLDSTEAVRRIAKGKQALQAIFDKQITTFIPPFNAWNEHTLTAMRMHGMNAISADMFTPIYADSVHYFPETLGHLMAQKGMWQAAEEAILECQEKDAKEKQDRRDLLARRIYDHSIYFMSNKVWQDYKKLREFANSHFDNMFYRLEDAYHLSEQEMKICLMVLLEYSNKQMAEILFVQPNTISKAKSKIAKQLNTSSAELRASLLDILA